MVGLNIFTGISRRRRKKKKNNPGGFEEEGFLQPFE